ncbi:MAG TPA: G8 domain-containing protein, partial [Chthoniobacteraceae bacterium]|nr:G8 domain-containing protein [Chthoniobacteraceae bacterium]
MNSSRIVTLLAVLLGAIAHANEAPLVRSAQSGPWSAPSTWSDGKIPGAGAKVQIRSGHSVVYDVSSTQPIRAIFVAGTLTFARDRDTELDVG